MTAPTVQFRQRRCTCGHPWIQHQDDDEGCWGPECLNEIDRERCQMFVENPVQPEPKRAKGRRATRARVYVEQSAKQNRADRLRVGTDRYNAYRAILMAREHGQTDEELEHVLAKKHQTVSAARNSLMNDGLIKDSGVRRRNESGALAIVWVVDPD